MLRNTIIIRVGGFLVPRIQLNIFSGKIMDKIKHPFIVVFSFENNQKSVGAKSGE